MRRAAHNIPGNWGLQPGACLGAMGATALGESVRVCAHAFTCRCAGMAREEEVAWGSFSGTVQHHSTPHGFL